MSADTNSIIATMMRKLSDEELVSIAKGSSYFGPFSPKVSKKKSTNGGNGAVQVQIRAVAKAKKPNGKAKKRARATSEEKQALLSSVVEAVSANPGVASSQISVITGIKGSKLITALRTLKAEKRIFQGGKLRFARYAVTQAAADKASAEARGK